MKQKRQRKRQQCKAKIKRCCSTSQKKTIKKFDVHSEKSSNLNTHSPKKFSHKRKYQRKNNKNCSKAHQQRKLPSHSKAKKSIEKCWGFNNTKQLTKQLNKQVPKLQRCTPACKHRTNNFPYRFVCCRLR